MNNDIKGFLFDLDNTLYNYDYAHNLALNNVVTYLTTTFSLDNQVVIRLIKQARNDVNVTLVGTAACHNRMLYFQLLLELLGIKIIPHSLRLYNIYWDSFLDAISLHNGVEEFFQTVHPAKKVCIITNLTAHIQHRKIDRLRLASFVDCLVTSEEVGKEKPHGDMFKRALEKLNLRSHQVIMIGDSYCDDIVGAMALGIESWLLNVNGKKDNYNHGIWVFNNFQELLGHLNV